MKLIHIILGVATLLIVASLVNLGIKAFHPEPKNPYLQGAIKTAPAFPREFNCVKGDTECTAEQNQYYAEQQRIAEENDAKQREYEAAMQVWNRDFFIAENIVGILIFIVAFGLLMWNMVGQAGYSVAVGTMAAGLWSIIWGYVRGWESVDDKTKFVVGLVVAVLVVGGSTWLMKRYYDKKGTIST